MRHTPLAVSLLLTAALLAPPPGAGAMDDGEEPSATPLAVTPLPESPDLDLVETHVTYLEDLDLLVFELAVKGTAGGTLPGRHGQLNGAPVLAYLFPTTLFPQDVGFGSAQGTLALAVTAHPDFDDTNLWDENNDRKYDDDGATWHTHWLVLAPDDSMPGKLRVQERRQNDRGVVPATAPDMPLYIDSPGFPVVAVGDTLKVLVPAERVGRKHEFRFDGVTAYMQVSTAPDTPMLGVYKVYDVLSGDLTLPYSVKRR
jgi:hypothetical protein